MQEILAGLVSGLIMGLVFLGAGIVYLITHPNLPERLAQRLPPGLPPTLAMLAYVFAAPPVWGAVGAIGGLIYKVFQSSLPGGGLGSPNRDFTIVALGIAVVAMIIVTAVTRKLLWLPLALCLAFAAVFGWVLPFLAG